MDTSGGEQIFGMVNKKNIISYVCCMENRKHKQREYIHMLLLDYTKNRSVRTERGNTMAIDTPLSENELDQFSGEDFARWYTDNGGYILSDSALTEIFVNELNSFLENGENITVNLLDDVFREYEDIQQWAEENNIENNTEEHLWQELDNTCVYRVLPTNGILIYL